MNRRQLRVVSLMTGLLITLSASVAFAQSQARVRQDRTTIWRIDAPVVAATVPAGTLLDVVGQAGSFYKVLIPEQFGGHGEVGRIAAGSFVFVPGSGDRTISHDGTAEAAPTAPADSRPASHSSPPRRHDEPAMAVRGFGQAGLMRPSAQESFRTVADQVYGFAFGGGVQLRVRNGLFVEGSFDQFRKTGERVFVYDDTVFPLGITDTITVRPLLFTAGYRFGSTRPVVPYVGGGLGVFHLTERTPFSEAGESIDETHTGYRMSGGVEFRGGQWLGTAFEAAYTHVPDALGNGGVSEIVDERDLGGFEFRVKLLFGR